MVGLNVSQEDAGMGAQNSSPPIPFPPSLLLLLPPPWKGVCLCVWLLDAT